jgi:DNA-binding transcriptional regulator PaaX
LLLETLNLTRTIGITIYCYEINFIVTSKSRTQKKQLIVIDQLWHLVRDSSTYKTLLHETRKMVVDSYYETLRILRNMNFNVPLYETGLYRTPKTIGRIHQLYLT